MVEAKYNYKDTYIGKFFDEYHKIGCWYDFGDEWNFTVEIKNKN